MSPAELHDRECTGAYRLSDGLHDMPYNDSVAIIDIRPQQDGISFERRTPRCGVWFMPQEQPVCRHADAMLQLSSTGLCYCECASAHGLFNDLHDLPHHDRLAAGNL
jgi:hypothetical protein